MEIPKEVFSKICVLDILSIEQKKLLLNSVIDTIYWNGDTGQINIKLLGTEKKNKVSISRYF